MAWCVRLWCVFGKKVGVGGGGGGVRLGVGGGVGGGGGGGGGGWGGGAISDVSIFSLKRHPIRLYRLLTYMYIYFCP